MNGAEHFRAAEELLTLTDDLNYIGGGIGTDRALCAVAHAMLANAAATTHATKMRAELFGQDEAARKKSAKEERMDAMLRDEAGNK